MIVQRLNNFLFQGDVQERYIVKNSNVTFIIIFCYIVFVKWLGPALMSNRKAFNLKYVMITYNLALCSCNAYVGCMLNAFIRKYWYAHCNAKFHPDHSKAMKDIMDIAWLLLLIKYSELLDTVLFVLRKKNVQVSFLHIFHHSTVIFIGWWCIRVSFKLGFCVAVGVTINTWIHVIMYYYYALAAFGPSMRKYLWWKKYLTLLQIAQFTFLLLYLMVGILTGCEELGPLELFMFAFGVLLLGLFYDFYKKDKLQRTISSSKCKAQ